MRVICIGVHCRAQIPDELGQLDTRVPVLLPQQLSKGEPPTEMAGVGSEAVSTPRPEAEVIPGSGNLGGVQNCFRWGGAKGWQRCPTQNMQSARDQPKLVDEYLAEEYSTGRVAGSLPPDLLP